MSYEVVKTATESFSDPTTCCDSSAMRDVATFASVNNGPTDVSITPRASIAVGSYSQLLSDWG